MIEINLLPQDTAARTTTIKTPSENQGMVAVVATLVAVYAVIFVSAFLIYSNLSSVKNKEESLEADNNELKAEIRDLEDEYKELVDALAVAKNQIALLEALDPEERLFWAEKLNILPLLVSDGIYLTSLEVSENVREVETKASREARAQWAKDKQGPEPPRLTQPIITQTLLMKGVSYVTDGTSDERLGQIVEYINTLRNDTATVPFSGEDVSFMEHFKPQIPYRDVRGNRLQERDITEFTLTMVSNPMGEMQE